MNLSLKLKLYREYKYWQPANVAKELGLSLESYNDLEKGRTKINGFLAGKLSELYQAPVEFFISDDVPHYLQADVMYTNCTFTNGNGGSGGYINHQYNDRGIDEILFLRKEEIKALEQQIADFRKQNDRLIELLGEKTND